MDTSTFKGHTPGPWRWRINEKFKQVELLGGKSLIVMDFVRYGMDRAAPRFRTNDCLMERIEYFSQIIPGEEHHASWNKTLSHPDAELMSAAPELLAENAELRALLDEAKGRSNEIRGEEKGGAGISKYS